MPILNYKDKRDNSWKEQVICKCSCGSMEHLLIFEKIFWSDGDQIVSELISVYLTPARASLWGRIKQAYRYAFRNHTLYYSHDVIFEEENIDQLEEAVKWIKERREVK